MLILLFCSCTEPVHKMIYQFPKVQNAANLSDTVKSHVIVFLDADCPISQYVIKPLNNLQNEYQGQIEVIGVIPGTYYSDAELDSFVTEFKVDFPLLIDANLTMVKRLDATITPEAYLIDSNGKVLYQGALDDKYERLGKARPLPNQQYLESAVVEFSSGKTITYSKTEAIGCIIER